MIRHQNKLSRDYDIIWQNQLKKGDYPEIIINRRKDRKLYYDIIQRYISKSSNSKILELGCGTGIDINIIKKSNDCLKAFGSDLSEKSIKLAMQVSGKFNNYINFFVADTLNLPITNDKIDIIFSQGLVEHFADSQKVIKEHMRVLKIDGILIVNAPQKYTGYTIMKKRLMKLGKWKLGWEKEFSYRDLKKIGRLLGLIEKEVFGYQYWLSRKEPVFILRDLYDKFHRRNPLQHIWLFQKIKGIYDTLWKFLEKKWGHHFLQNIVIVFQKRSNEDTAC